MRKERPCVQIEDVVPLYHSAFVSLLFNIQDYTISTRLKKILSSTLLVWPVISNEPVQ